MNGYKWIVKDPTGEPVEWAILLEIGIPMVKVGSNPIAFSTEKEVNAYMRKNHLYQYNGYYKALIKIE